MSILDMQNYLIDDNSNSDDNSSSDDNSNSEDNSNNDENSYSYEDNSSSSDEDSIYFGDLNDLRVYKFKIHREFREIAATIRKDDVNGLSVALDNFKGNIDEHFINEETALHYACEYSSLQCFKLLLENGANIEARNAKESNPLHMACGYGSFKIVEIILNYPTHRNILNRIVQSLNKWGETPLHEAVVSTNINIIKLLLNVGASNIDGLNKMLQSVDIFGNTPLHHAAKYGNAKTIKLLLEFGVSTKISNYDGNIPWELAKPNSKIRRILDEHDDEN